MENVLVVHNAILGFLSQNQSFVNFSVHTKRAVLKYMLNPELKNFQWGIQHNYYIQIKRKM